MSDLERTITKIWFSYFYKWSDMCIDTSGIPKSNPLNIMITDLHRTQRIFTYSHLRGGGGEGKTKSNNGTTKGILERIFYKP